MSERVCKVCGNPYRKGKLAWVMGRRGLQRVRVCTGCADKGATIVAATPIVSCKCGKPATKCGTCSTQSEEKQRASSVEGVVKALDGVLKGMKTFGPDPSQHQKDFIDGKREGIELALDMLKSGKF